MNAPPADRLQPALLDRLFDDAPQEHVEAATAQVMSKSQLRTAVLRDLSWLFNAAQSLSAAEQQRPALATSVLNFGLPELSGRLASMLDLSHLERTIRLAILRFEPRILTDTLRVCALDASSVLDTHNLLEFEISGHLWAQPVPMEILLRTQVDLEAGQVQVLDRAPAASVRAAR